MPANFRDVFVSNSTNNRENRGFSGQPRGRDLGMSRNCPERRIMDARTKISQADKPRIVILGARGDSEEFIGRWFCEVGLPCKHVGGDASEGPPDWEVTHDGETIGVEAVYLPKPESSRELPYGVEHSIAGNLGRILQEQLDDSERLRSWNLHCEYSRRDLDRFTSRGADWHLLARRALCEAVRKSPVEGHPLDPDSWRGDCTEFMLCSCKPQGQPKIFVQVHSNMGALVEPEIEHFASSLCRTISHKAGRVRNGPRGSKYEKWWLVVHDGTNAFMNIDQSGAADSTRRWESMKVKVCAVEDAGVWDKIIVVSSLVSRHGKPCRFHVLKGGEIDMTDEPANW